MELKYQTQYKHCLQTVAFQHAFNKIYTWEICDQGHNDATSRQISGFSSFITSTSLINIGNVQFRAKQQDISNLKGSKLKFVSIYKKTTIYNNKSLVNKLKLHCLQKRTMLTLRIVFEQTKTPLLSSKVLFLFVKDLYLYITIAAAKIQLRLQNKHEPGNLWKRAVWLELGTFQLKHRNH